jgi:CHASE3 domain sensor protein
MRAPVYREPCERCAKLQADNERLRDRLEHERQDNNAMANQMADVIDERGVAVRQRDRLLEALERIREQLHPGGPRTIVDQAIAEVDGDGL